MLKDSPRALALTPYDSNVPSITRKTATGRPRRDAAQARLFDAVERLLAAGESYTALGIGRICEEAGVARSAFYTNFANKAELLLEVVASATENIFSVSRAWAEGDRLPGKDELEAAIADSLRVWREHAPLVAAYLELSTYDPQVGAYWQEQFGTIIDAVQRRIEHEQRAGKIPKTLDPRTTAQFIVFGAERLAAQHVATRDAAEDAALARHTADSMWRMMYGG